MLLKNGEMVTTVWAESVPSWATSSNVAVLHLSRGDRVWLSVLSRAPYLHGYMYTTFSGFHIFDNWHTHIHFTPNQLSITHRTRRDPPTLSISSSFEYEHRSWCSDDFIFSL